MSALRRQYGGSFELLRRAVRNSIGFRSPVYQLGSSLLTSAEVIRREGYVTWKRLRALSARKDSIPDLILLRGLKTLAQEEAVVALTTVHANGTSQIDFNPKIKSMFAKRVIFSEEI